jgi:isopentenyl-diphosphate delta-isomerase
LEDDGTTRTMRPADVSTPPVILVDEHDRPLGLAEKLSVHESGALHRAVSVFAFDASGALLLQRRAHGKYHSGGLWSNSACSHPRDGETPSEAAARCLREEMGLECEALEPAGAFIYRAQVSPTLVEHEFDHVFVARVSAPPAPRSEEVAAWRAVPVREVDAEWSADPARFSAWFPLALAHLRRQPAFSRLLAGAVGAEGEASAPRAADGHE